MFSNVLLLVVAMAVVVYFFVVPQVKNFRQYNKHFALAMLGMVFICAMFLAVMIIPMVSDPAWVQTLTWSAVGCGLAGFLLFLPAGLSGKKPPSES